MAPSSFIRYVKGCKYQLVDALSIYVAIHPEEDIVTDFIELTTHGRLTGKAGYAWDGSSGPVRDTKKNMRGSAAHDMLYQLIRLGLLDPKYRLIADIVYVDMCEEDGTWAWLAGAYRKVLKIFGAWAADPKNKKKTYIAPGG